MGSTSSGNPRGWNPAARSIRVPVLLGLLVVALITALWWGYRNVLTPPRPPTRAEICATSSPTPFTTSRVDVSVFNGGARGGLAGQVGANLKQAGFNVRTISNTDERVTTTIVRGAAMDSPQVVLVAAWVPGAVVQADGRQGATVDVLVGKDFAPMSTTAPRSTMLPIEGCGPTPTPTASPTPSAAPS